MDVVHGWIVQVVAMPDCTLGCVAMFWRWVALHALIVPQYSHRLGKAATSFTNPPRGPDILCCSYVCLWGLASDGQVVKP